MKSLENKRPIRFVNVGEDPPNPPPIWIGRRQWPACVKYGFVSAGQGKRYSNPFYKLIEGDFIAAFITGCGYVGIGQICKSAVPIAEFDFNGFKMKNLTIDPEVISGINTKSYESIKELPLLRESIFENADNEKTEVVVKVKWVEETDKSNAYWIKNIGLFASRSTQCSLENQPKTLEFLAEAFQITFNR